MVAVLPHLEVGLDLRVLGPLEAANDGRLLTPGAHLPQVVLALLAARAPQAVPRDVLIDQVWSDRAPATAPNVLQIYISQIRKSIGRDRVRTDGAGYSLVLAHDELDVWRFNDLRTAGIRDLGSGEPARASEQLRAALALWRGPAYAGLDQAPLLAVEAARLEEERLAALEARIEADLECGRGGALVPELESLVATHPLRERFWAQLVRALYVANRQGHALEALRRAREVLREELGVDPGPELQDLEQAVLRHDQHLRSTVVPALPPLPAALAVAGPTFVGREPDLAWLLAALDRACAEDRPAEAVTVLIEGAPGIGKTRLIAEAAKVARGRGVAITYATGLDGLAVRETPVGHAAADAAELMSPSRQMVIIDNLEELPAASAPELARRLERSVAGQLTVLTVAPALTPLPVRVVLARAAAKGILTRRALTGLSLDDVRAIAARYAPTATADEIDVFASTSPTDPQSLHEAASSWAADRAATRLTEAAQALPATAARVRDEHQAVVSALLEARHAHELRRAHHALGPDTDSYLASLTPYRGLAAYREADAVVFFGRERLVAEVLAKLLHTSVLLLVGPSGAGKSSLARAGVIPALRAGALPGADAWLIDVHTPDSLAARPVETIAGPRLLVVDQLEEAFTALTAGQRDHLDETLAAALSSQDTRLVATLRADFFPRLDELRCLAPAVDGAVLVGPMGPDELREVIERPAVLTGLQLEPGLADRLLDDTRDQNGALPLLSTALLSLWDHRDSDKLTLRAYETSGGVAAAVRDAAEDAYASLAETDQDVARRVLLRLAETVEPGRYVRRRAPLAEVAPPGDVAASRVVECLASRRLITVAEDTTEVAHEALFTEWPRLGLWLREDAEGRRLRRELTPAASGWAAAGRQPSDLYRGPRLAAAWEYAQEHPADLTELEQDFLTASRDLADQDRAQRRRSIRRLRILAAALAVALTGSAFATRVAVQQQHEAATQAAAARASALRADSRRIASQALLERSPDTALLMAAQGLRLDANSDTRAAMLTVLHRYPSLTKVFDLGVAAWTLHLSSDGNLAAVGVLLPRDGTTLLDLRTGESLGRPVPGTPGAFSADSDLLAVSGGRNRGEVLIYDTHEPLDRQTPTALRVPNLTGHLAFVGDRLVAAVRTARGLSLNSYPVTGEAGPPQGRHLATVSSASHGAVSLWQPTPGGGLLVASPDSSPGGRPGDKLKAVRVTARGTVRNAAALRLPAGADSTASFALRPDGGVLATQTDSELILSDPRTGRRLSSYPRAGQAGPVRWSPDGRLLAQAGPADAAVFRTRGGISLVSVLTGREGNDGRPPIDGPAREAITDLAFTPDGRRLYTGGGDGHLLAWNPLLTTTGRVLVAATRPEAGGRFVDQVAFAAPPGEGPVLMARLGSGLELWSCSREHPACSGRPSFTPEPEPDTRIFRASSNTDGTRFLVETYQGDRPGGKPTWYLLDGSGVDTFGGGSLRRSGDQLDLDHENTRSGALLSPDGHTIAALIDRRTLGLWTTDPFGLERRISLPAPSGVDDGPDVRVPSLAAYTPNSDGVVVVHGHGAYLLDLALGRPVADLEVKPWLDITSFGIAGDGRRAAIGYVDGTMQVLSAPDWRAEPISLEPHPGPVTSVSFAGEELLTASQSEVRMFDLREPAPATELLKIPFAFHEPEVVSLGGGRVLVSGVGIAGPSAPVLWDLDPNALLRKACEIAGRNLSTQEWRRVLPDRTASPTCP